MYILWVVDTKLLLLHTCNWKRNHVVLNVKRGFNLLRSLFCFGFLCFISLCGVKLWPWKVRKWRKWKSEIWGVWRWKAQGTTGQPVWLWDWNVSGLPKLITLEPTYLYVDSLRHKSYIMSPRWHLGLIYVGTKLAINCTCVPIVAPFQTEHVYRNRKHGCSRSTPSLCCVNSLPNTTGIQDLHAAFIFHGFQPSH